MQNQSIFTKHYAPHQSRQVPGFDSVNSGSTSVGVINGQYRTLPALVVEGATELDNWRLVNLCGAEEGTAKFDCCAVLGAVDDEQAKSLALMQHGRFFDAVATDVIETSHQGLMRHLSVKNYHLSGGTIQQWQIERLQDVTCGEVPAWDGINLLSHGGSVATLLHDMTIHDDHHALTDNFPGIPNMLQDMDVEIPEYDAVIVEYQHLDRLMSMLTKAMGDAAVAGVKLVNQTRTDPFKKNNVAQVAVNFEFDDGQTVTVLFHNPDSTPSKLAAKDTMISWKWLLNKRDVSVAVQPNQGEGIKLPVLAQRIMQLVNKNSVRFKRTQANRDSALQQLTEAEQRFASKQQQVGSLDTDIQQLQSELDSLLSSSVQQQAPADPADPADPAPEPLPEPGSDPAVNDAGEGGESTDEKFLNGIIAGDIDPLTVDYDNLLGIAERDDGNESLTALVTQALEVINKAELASSQNIA